MTPTTISADTTRSTDHVVVGLVSAAHFISHYYILILGPLFPFVRVDFGVSYTELGAAIAVFNVLTGLLQTPAGFLTDRTSARAVLVGAIMLGAGSLVVAALSPSFYVFFLMFALLGAANAVYHPANYALLSGRISARRMSHAYSIHIFAGYLGTALAPVTLLYFAEAFGWRGAYMISAVAGFAIAGMILVFGEPLGGRAHTRPKAASDTASQKTDWHLLLSVPVLLNLVFFMLLAITGGGIGNYGAVALEALWGMSLSLATTALTVYLLMSAFGVLCGGFLSARTERYDIIAIVGLALSALALIPVALFDLGTPLLIALMAISGFFTGLIMPSRDMLVRAITPPGAFGKVFGFVTSGFNIGGIIAPPFFGYLMDNGEPRGVILGIALCALISIPTVMVNVKRGHDRQPA